MVLSPRWRALLMRVAQLSMVGVCDRKTTVHVNKEAKRDRMGQVLLSLRGQAPNYLRTSYLASLPTGSAFSQLLPSGD
jgi:hypothetical protein